MEAAEGLALGEAGAARHEKGGGYGGSRGPTRRGTPEGTGADRELGGARAARRTWPASTARRRTGDCPFYFKIGACRHGDRCSRQHLSRPSRRR